MKRADLAQYTVKQNGRGHWQRFSDADELAFRRRSKRFSALRHHARSNRIEARFSALNAGDEGPAAGIYLGGYARLDDAPLSGDDLLQEAARCGVESAVVEKLVERGLGALQDLRRRGVALPPVWVPLAVDDLKINAFADRFLGLAESAGFSADELVAIIPSTAMHARSSGAIHRTCELLREEGIALALDGVGSGPLPLECAAEMDIRHLRLSPRFCALMAQAGTGHRLVGSTLAALEPLADAILTPAPLPQSLWQSTHGAHFLQAGPAMPFETLEGMLRETSLATLQASQRAVG